MDGVKVLTKETNSVQENYRQHEKIIFKDRNAVSSVLFKIGKRCFDVLGSLMGLTVLAPLFLIIALAIRIEDGGYALYKQDRNGLYGKVFHMYKFRSMCVNAEQMHQNLIEKNELDGPAFKLRNDPRVTRVGRFIRRTSLDELPQFINILKGEMSFVGPRPLPTYETEQCNDYQKQRMLVKPGLTCYWQCSGRNNISFDEWIELDLKYIKEASLWVDFKIMCKTVISVISGDGAY